jgi:predicted Zn-dependent peptidase
MKHIVFDTYMKGDKNEATILENGLVVVSHHIKGVSPVSGMVVVSAGTAHATKATAVVPHLLEHLHLSQSLDGDGVAARAHQLRGMGYCEDNAGTWRYKSVFGYSLEDKGPLFYRFTPKNLERYFTTVAKELSGLKIVHTTYKREIKAIREEQQATLRIGRECAFDEACFGQWFLGNLAKYDLQSLDVITPGDVRDFYTQHYGPNRTTILYAGNTDHARQVDFWQRNTKAWSAALPLAIKPTTYRPAEFRFSEPPGNPAEDQVRLFFRFPLERKKYSPKEVETASIVVEYLHYILSDVLRLKHHLQYSSIVDFFTDDSDPLSIDVDLYLDKRKIPQFLKALRGLRTPVHDGVRGFLQARRLGIRIGRETYMPDIDGMLETMQNDWSRFNTVLSYSKREAIVRSVKPNGILEHIETTFAGDMSFMVQGSPKALRSIPDASIFEEAFRRGLSPRASTHTAPRMYREMSL